VNTVKIGNSFICVGMIKGIRYMGSNHNINDPAVIDITVIKIIGEVTVFVSRDVNIGL